MVEPVLKVDLIPYIPIPTQNTLIPSPILTPAKSGINTALVRTAGMGRVHWWEWLWPSVTVPLHRRPRIPSPRNAVSVSNLFLNDHLSSCAVVSAGPTCGPHK